MSEATLTVEEIGEIMDYVRTHPHIKFTRVDGNEWSIMIVGKSDGKFISAIHPRTLLDIIHDEKNQPIELLRKTNEEID